MLNAVETQKMLIFTKKYMTDILEGYDWNLNLHKREIKQNYEEYLNSLKAKRGIYEYKVNCFERNLTWKDLYPKWYKRFAAIFAYEILKLNSQSKVKWYHKILPYKIYQAPIIDRNTKEIIEKFENESLENEEKEHLLSFLDSLNNYSPSFYAELKIPKKEDVCEIMIKPTKSIEWIDIQIDVQNNNEI